MRGRENSEWSESAAEDEVTKIWCIVLLFHFFSYKSVSIQMKEGKKPENISLFWLLLCFNRISANQNWKTYLTTVERCSFRSVIFCYRLVVGVVVTDAMFLFSHVDFINVILAVKWIEQHCRHARDAAQTPVVWRLLCENLLIDSI